MTKQKLLFGKIATSASTHDRIISRDVKSDTFFVEVKSGKIHKSVNPHLPFGVDIAASKLLENEFNVLSHLTSKGANTPQVIDYFPSDRLLVMELIPVHSLSWVLNQDSFSVAESIALFLEIAKSIETNLHQKGVVHHDLSPANLLVGSGIIPIDFASSWILENPDSTSLCFRDTPRSAYEYASPEEYALKTKNKTGFRSDIFNLGAILYELVVHICAFNKYSPSISHDPTPLASPFWDAISRALNKDWTKRPKSCTEFADEVNNIAAREKLVLPDCFP